MLMRNLVCSVVTIAVLWALGKGIYAIAAVLDARNSNSGFAIFVAMGLSFMGLCLLIAWRIDVRAGRREGLTRKRQRVL